MSKILTPFERVLKDKMSGYEMPHEQRSWTDLQKRLGSMSSSNYPWIVALVATIVVTASGSVALYRHRHTPASAYAMDNQSRFSFPFSANSNGEGTVNFSDSPQNILSLTDGTLENQSSKDSPSMNHSQTSSSSESNNLTQNQALNAQQLNNQSISNVDGNSTTSTGIVNTEAPKVNKNLEFNSSVRQACAGVEVDFHVTNGPNEGSYLWNFGDGHFSDAVNPKHKFSKAGNYDISLSITNNNGRINTTEMSDMITIHDAPNSDFIWDFVNESPNTPEVKIKNNSKDAVKFEWKFSDGSISNEANPAFILNSKGKQPVSVTLVNLYGCEGTSVKQISVNTDFNLDAKNSYTPGDGLFMPSGLKQSKVNFVMAIYDKSGNSIFETKLRSKGWDGKLTDGHVASVGESYDWRVIITNDLTLEQKYYNGTFTISP